MTEKPSIVFVPGAWHAAQTWDKVSSTLIKQGFTCTAVELATTSGDTSASFEDDVKVTTNAIQTQLDSGRNVIVVVHSYGGVVGQSAIRGLTQLKDKSTQLSPSVPKAYVTGLIMIASGFAQPNMVFLDGTGGTPPPSWRLDPSGFSEIQVPARELFYHDLPEVEGEMWVSRLRKQSSRAFTEGKDVMYPGWQDVPVWVLVTTEDKALPVEVQYMMVDMVTGTADVTVREIASSHSPMLSKPSEVAGYIVEAARAFSDSK